jgi:hypothetical protein
VHCCQQPSLKFLTQTPVTLEQGAFLFGVSMWSPYARSPYFGMVCELIGRPRNRVVAEGMWRNRANYHYAV